MRRRAVLATFILCASGLLAGCSVEREQIPVERYTVEPNDETDTPMETPTRASSTPRPGDVPVDRVVDGEAVSEDDLGATADRWFGLERLRYSDGSEGVHDTVTPDRGWFVAYEFTLENHGETRMDALPDSQFKLRVDGETYEHIHEFPAGVQFRDVDQPASEPQIRDLAWYGGLDPGDAVSLQLVFDVPIRREFRHYLVWDHESRVEGTSEPVYLVGRRVPIEEGDGSE